MYQFYYADTAKPIQIPEFQQQLKDRYTVTAIRPTVWEEHCLECAAPLCFNNCAHYIARSDGRCKRFDNGLQVFEHENACCGQGVHVKFRKWANMMTVIFPPMLSVEDYGKLFQKNQTLGRRLKTLADSRLPRAVRWQGIRIPEYLRRRSLRNMSSKDTAPDAFVFHAYSHQPQAFQLIVEIFDDHTSVFRTSLTIQPGENLQIRSCAELSSECLQAGYVLKVYPEQDLEAELDILWCDFVKGTPVAGESPAPQVKCVVWDLDNTVWDGTVIETDDPQTLTIKPAVLDTMQALDERGILQSIASKNDYDTVYPLLEEKGLTQYFLYPQIHWGPKSGSIQQIAKFLNIGVDSLALIDDSAFERNEVSSVLPQVRTYDVTEVPDILKYPECLVKVTQESRRRREMYQAEEKRQQILQSGTGDIAEFIKSCHLKITLFTPQSEEELARCYELILRTNQLNMSGIKYTQEEFEKVLAKEGHTCFGVSCKDDFGDYGIVAFGQYRVEDANLVFTEFAMSCRIAGKYVESALFSSLLQKERCEQGEFTVNITKKNQLLRNTLEQIGFEALSKDLQRICYRFDKNMKHCMLVNVEQGDM